MGRLFRLGLEEEMRSRTLTSLLTAIFLVLLVAATLATRETKASGPLYVSTDGLCGGYAPCYTNVQDALLAAFPFDEILVATGTYTVPAGTVATINKTVTLLGGWDSNFTTRDPQANPTTLDAQGLGRVIRITGTISPTIDGFIITGGNATGETWYPRQGGGIHTRLANPLIQNNVITNNVASTDTLGYGGGLYAGYALASPVVSGNLILSNTASTSSQGHGGGLYLYQSSATLSGNTIRKNTAPGNGGGLMLYQSNPTLKGNRIISNTASSSGGGLYVSQSAPFTLTNNIVAQNEANNQGGGMQIWGVSGFPTSGALINNTIAQNNLGSGGQGINAVGTTTLTLTNNIVVSHTYGIYVVPPATATADYTLFFGNTTDNTGGSITSTNEITGDPLFVDPSAWNYHIQVASAAVNRGTFTGAPSTDFEGDPRPYDCFIDIGADENTASDECKRIYLPLIMKNY